MRSFICRKSAVVMVTLFLALPVKGPVSPECTSRQSIPWETKENSTENAPNDLLEDWWKLKGCAFFVELQEDEEAPRHVETGAQIELGF
jgi:hypothetical protein